MERFLIAFHKYATKKSYKRHGNAIKCDFLDPSQTPETGRNTIVSADSMMTSHTRQQHHCPLFMCVHSCCKLLIYSLIYPLISRSSLDYFIFHSWSCRLGILKEIFIALLNPFGWVTVCKKVRQRPRSDCGTVCCPTPGYCGLQLLLWRVSPGEPMLHVSLLECRQQCINLVRSNKSRQHFIKGKHAWKLLLFWRNIGEKFNI